MKYSCTYLRVARVHAEPRRTATLVATVDALSVAAVDDALDLFDVLMASRILGPSKRAAAAAPLETLPELENASNVLARVGREPVLLLEGAGEQVDVAAVWARLEKVADLMGKAIANGRAVKARDHIEYTWVYNGKTIVVRTSTGGHISNGWV